MLEATAETGFMQSSWWADFRVTTGFEHFGAILRTPDGIVGGAMVQRYSFSGENCFYYIQDGPVLPAEASIAGDVFEAILEEIDRRRTTDQQRVSHLRIEPRWESLPDFVNGFTSLQSKDRYLEPRNTLCIDLRPSEDAILSQMKPKGRYNIRVAQRHGVLVSEDNSERGLGDFLSIYEDTAARQRFGAKPPEYFEELTSVLWSCGRGSLFFAEHEGVRVAAALVVYFGKRATYFFGGSLVKNRQVMAPCLLHFEIMRQAKGRNYEWYDLWGVSPENKTDDPWRDISVFKRKFGGREVRLVPALDYVYDQEAYQLYVGEMGEGG